MGRYKMWFNDPLKVDQSPETGEGVAYRKDSYEQLVSWRGIPFKIYQEGGKRNLPFLMNVIRGWLGGGGGEKLPRDLGGKWAVNKYVEIRL
jgi:hypothetical protein